MFLLSQSTHRMLVRYHERIGHLYVPNLRARVGNDEGGYFVVTNSLGFRSDHEYPRERTGRPRILMFGDSYTAGDECENRDRYSDVLASILDCEVYNFGLSGSGTDQHLLIYREFAQDIVADLIVICVQVDSISRIQLSHRESVDRVTGRRLMVPKPYFELVEGKLKLHHSPVPAERPEVGSVKAETSELPWQARAKKWYRDSQAGSAIRKTLSGKLQPLRSTLLRASGITPYPEYSNPDSPGWKLMSSILKQFIHEVAPLPVLIVPVPTREYFVHGVQPGYQAIFETLVDPVRGVHTADISNPIVSLPPETRSGIAFPTGAHFTPFGNEMAARIMAEKIRERKLLPVGTDAAAPRIPAAPHARRVRSGSTYVLGLSCFYHNSAAALIRDGEIVAAAEEERFSRVKNDRRFPAHAVNYVLEEGGINARELKAVVYYDNAPLTFQRILDSQFAAGDRGEDMWQRSMPSWIRYKLHLPRLIRTYLRHDVAVFQESHHRSHAASAFYPSPFDRSAILTVDGVGEWATASIGVGQGNQVKLTHETRFPNSLGLLYSAFTQFTGFKVNSGEYKMMGLAPYGEPRYVDQILSHLIHMNEDGSVELKMDYFAFLEKPEMTGARFAGLFGGPARKPDSRITRREMDLAKSIQWVTEESLLRMARHARRITGEEYLCLAGGVALNCVANGRILREGPFRDIWIQPAAGDSGGALGSALDLYHTYYGGPRILREDRRSPQGGSLLGPEFGADEVRSYLDTYGFPYREMPEEERLDCLTQALVDGKVVGHFSGRLEFGPRALGARSILGDPRNPAMQADLNLKIKYRESFRPFAPAVLAERVSDYFELDRESPYMLIVAPVREERRLKPGNDDGATIDREDLLPVVRQIRSDIPAVTHIDYSARIQTVNRADHPPYYDLIRRFEQKTGYGVIVNTSFNVRGEPIVCTPADAYRCFMRTEMNVLNLGSFVLFKEDQPAWHEDKGEGIESDDAESKAVHRMSPLEEKLAATLRQLFHEKLVPLARRAVQEGKVRTGQPAQRSSGTAWEPAAWSDPIASTFEIPAGLFESEKDSKALVAELRKYWGPLSDDPELCSLLEELVRLGQNYLPTDNLEEQVPDGIYVMF